MTAPNSREGIEEKRYNPRQGGKEILTDKMIVEEVRKGDNYVIWKSPKTTVHIIPDGKLKEIFHQELQKALEIQAIEIREEEANEYNKIIEQELQKERERCITKAWSYIVDATHAESWSRDELRKAVQSELDQPDALTE